MPARLEAFLTVRRRKWIYRSSTALLVVLGAYGLASADQASAWALFAAAVTGMADANTQHRGDTE